MRKISAFLLCLISLWILGCGCGKSAVPYSDSSRYELFAKNLIAKAENGNVEAQLRIALPSMISASFFYPEEAFGIDTETSREWIKKAAENNNPLAKAVLLLNDKNSECQSFYISGPNKNLGYDLLEKLSSEGNGYASFIIACILSSGQYFADGDEQGMKSFSTISNGKEVAKQYLNKAVEQAFVPAILYVARSNKQKEEDIVNDKKTMELLQKAIDQENNEEAIRFLKNFQMKFQKSDEKQNESLDEEWKKFEEVYSGRQILGNNENILIKCSKADNLLASAVYQLVYVRGNNVGIDLLRKQAAKGNAFAQKAAGIELVSRKDKQEQQEGCDWLRKAADFGDGIAAFKLAEFLEGQEAFIDNIDDLIRLKIRAADNSDFVVFEIERSIIALRKIKSAIPSQNASSKDHLNFANLLIKNGFGPASIKWLKLSGEAGNAEALKQLCLFYARGTFCKPDLQLSGSYALKAANTGDPKALAFIAYLYSPENNFDLRGVFAPNTQEWHSWLIKAAEAGDLQSLIDLGECYEKGLFGEQKTQEAINCYKKVSEKVPVDEKEKLAIANANLKLGKFCLLSNTEFYNLTDAHNFLEKASSDGNEEASILLGDLNFAEKKNSAIALDNAEKYYCLAAKNGSSIAKDKLQSVALYKRVLANDVTAMGDYLETLKDKIRASLGYYNRSSSKLSDKDQENLNMEMAEINIKIIDQKPRVLANLARFMWLENRPQEGDIAQLLIAAESDLNILRRADGKTPFVDIPVQARFAFLKSLADKGSPCAQFYISELFGRGEGTIRDGEAAASYLKKAASGGHNSALESFGRKLLEGRDGFNQDLIEAYVNLSLAKAFTQKDGAAFGYYSDAYTSCEKKLTPEQILQAQNEVFTRYVALVGTASTLIQEPQTKQEILGVAENYWFGSDGIPINYEKALQLYKKLAEMGDSNAMFALSLAFGNGQGTLPDKAEEEKWARKAANLGHSKAQFNLGVNIWNSNKDSDSLIEAHMWLNLACSKTDDYQMRRAMETLTRKLTKDQVKEAEKLAREWKPTETINQ